MSLEDLNQRLHSRDTHLEKGRLIVSDERSAEEITQEKEAFQKVDDWQTSPTQEMYLISPDLKKARKKKFYIALGSIVFLGILGAAAYAGYIFLQRQNAVSVEISGPKSVASAERVSFDISYANSSFGETKDNILALTIPENFQIEADPKMTVTGRHVEIKLDNILPGSKGKVSLMGKFYGGKGDKVVLDALLRYTPKGASSQFESRTSFDITLATSPLFFEVEAPSEVGSGQEMDYVVTYENKSPETFRNLRIVADYPDDYQYLSATVPPSEGDNAWFIAELKPNQSGKIVIHGSLAGEKDTAKTLKATIGVLQGDNSLFAYNSLEKRTQIAASQLTISQEVNEGTEVVVNPGDSLRYVIRYKNTSALGMREVVIAESLDTTYLDVSRLALEHGAYDQNTKKITWRASDIPELARLEPGQGGEIRFTIPVLKTLPVEAGRAKDLTIRSLATIDSPDVKSVLAGNKIIGSNLLQVKVGALVALSTTVYYGATAFPNTGPLPPVAGSETTYTIKAKVESSSNDLTQSKVTFVLPSGVVYKEKSSPGDETVSFNTRTNELTWEIGTLNPRKEKVLQFQVAITPNSSQVGRDVELLKGTNFYAKENFTKKEVMTQRKTLSNNLSEDNTVSDQSGVVKAN